MSLVKAQGLGFSYEEHPVLEDVDFSIENGEYVALIGPNGGGKTTLLRLLLGFLEPRRGSITIQGKAPRLARGILGYVPQYIHMDRDFPVLARDVVAMGLGGARTVFPWIKRPERLRVESMMDALKVLHLADQSFGYLSGGEKQRVLICRALVSEPQLILLDEPTANVDSHVESDIFKLLSELNEKMTILLVTHDLGVVSSQVDQVLCVNRRLVRHSGTDLDWKTLIHDSYHYDVQPVHHHHRM